MSDQSKMIDLTAQIRQAVRDRYGQAAETFEATGQTSCCGGDSTCGCGSGNDVTALAQVEKLYQAGDVSELPDDVTGLSLGCGDPVTLAELTAGQVVVDLGSGGGIDCFLAGKRVGPTGRVIGVDMTPAMLEKARANKAKLGADNVEFRLGEIEHLPIGDGVADVIISNCVINLSTDKAQVLREAYRVLKPGGKLSVSDISTDGPLPASVKRDLASWAGCIAGAVDVDDHRALIEAAGFVAVSITPVYFDDGMLAEAQTRISPVETVSNDELRQTIFSAKITARKP